MARHNAVLYRVNGGPPQSRNVVVDGDDERPEADKAIREVLAATHNCHVEHITLGSDLPKKKTSSPHQKGGPNQGGPNQGGGQQQG